MNTDKNGKTQRIRTVTWDDPREHAMDAESVSGLDFLRSIRDGTTPPPPVAGLLGYRIREIERGRAVFEIEPDEFHYNPFGTVHGGIAGLLLDTAMTSAVLSTLPKGYLCSTIEFKINFVRPMVCTTGLVRSRGRVIHAGSRTATAEGKIAGTDGTLYAHGTSTCMIFKHRGR